MDCQRAAVILRGLEKNELGADADEIEEMITRGLAVEADPDDLALLQWLRPVVREFSGSDVTDPHAAYNLSETLQKTEQELKSDWYRMKTSKAQIALREESRVAMRRALALLSDKSALEPLLKIANETRLLAPNAQYVRSPALGVEYYALTHKGWRVRRSLKVRLGRFGNTPFKSFLQLFEKTEGKMRAFAGEASTLSQNIGYVKKAREQVVIGLLKTGQPASNALNVYWGALKETGAADTAVTCTRNAATFGSTGNAAQRLRQAQEALRSAGVRMTPITMGAAKSLLMFDPPSAGVPRFVELIRGLQARFGPAERTYKWTGRLIPATGSPAEILRRVHAAETLLGHVPSPSGVNFDLPFVAVALAAMARTEDAMPGIVTRFREIERELVQSGLSPPHIAENDALECIACAGTPPEVADTVATLMEQIAQGRRPERSDFAVAIAFAKRFSY